VPERPARVVLVGFMGSGKSSIGRLLARRLGYRFEDMDRRIERRAGRTIATIFQDSGEEAFREMEREEARAVASLRDRVVATGEGAFAPPRRGRSCRRGALTVWLRCDLADDPGAGRGRRLPSPCREP
jgi:shikimate kinase